MVAPQGPAQTSRPGTVTAAGIIWIIYGSLGLLGNLMSLAGGRVGAGTITGFVISIAFLSGGIQALTGKAKSLLGSGIASIILGALVLVACLALGSLVRELHVAAGIMALVGIVIGGGFLILPGILACVGNARFKAWRAYKGL